MNAENVRIFSHEANLYHAFLTLPPHILVPIVAIK